jgi:hypothetical protein
MIGPIATPPALSTLATAVGAATHRFDAAAERVAANGPDIDGMVGMIEARTELAADAAAFRFASDTQGSLIDLLA